MMIKREKYLEEIKKVMGKQVMNVDRQNILNNPYALTEIRKATNISSIIFEDKLVLTKNPYMLG